MIPCDVLIRTLCLGGTAGYIYGLLLLKTRTRALVNSDNTQKYMRRALGIALSTGARLIILFGCIAYLLLTSTINPILLCITFIGTFWLKIFTTKA